jgi:hypothetical protein
VGLHAVGRTAEFQTFMNAGYRLKTQVIYTGGDRMQLMDEINRMDDEGWTQLLKAAEYDPTVLAFLALWPRFWKGNKAKMFYEFLAETREGRLANDLPFPLAGRSPSELQIILRELVVFQKTYGCTQACSFCDVAAPYPRVNGEDSLEHLGVSQITSVYRLAASSSASFSPMPYWASEFMNHPQALDIVNGLKKMAPLVSHVPVGSEESLAEILKKQGGGRISVTGRNLLRVRRLIELVYADDVDQVLEELDLPESLPADGSGDFSLYLYVADSLVIRSPQPKVQTLGANMRKGEHPESLPAFGCQSGVMLTPLGLYNKVHNVAPDAHYPFGDLIVPLDSLMPIEAPRHLIGLPVEVLLRHVVVCENHVSGAIAKRQSKIIDVKDAKGEKWRAHLRREGRRWIVSVLGAWKR